MPDFGFPRWIHLLGIRTPPLPFLFLIPPYNSNYFSVFESLKMFVLLGEHLFLYFQARLNANLQCTYVMPLFHILSFLPILSRKKRSFCLFVPYGCLCGTPCFFLAGPINPFFRFLRKFILVIPSLLLEFPKEIPSGSFFLPQLGKPSTLICLSALSYSFVDDLHFRAPFQPYFESD